MNIKELSYNLHPIDSLSIFKSINSNLIHKQNLLKYMSKYYPEFVFNFISFYTDLKFNLTIDKAATEQLFFEYTIGNFSNNEKLQYSLTKFYIIYIKKENIYE
jgi:hypothetical protein